MEFFDANTDLIDIFSGGKWPAIEGISFRIATDAERENWANGNEVKTTGDDDDGLWSDAIFGNNNSMNAYGIIKLPHPLLNPLFMTIKKFRANEYSKVSQLLFLVG